MFNLACAGRPAACSATTHRVCRSVPVPLQAPRRAPGRLVTARAADVSRRTGFLGGLSDVGAAPPTADSPLGELVQRLLPGPLFFLPALLYPTITVAAALAAAHTTAAVQAVAALPAVQVLGPLSALLHHLAASKLSATALAVAGSLATAVLSFVVMPTMDWVLGRDLRAPSEADEEAAAAQGGQDTSYRWVLWVYAPIHVAALAAACHVLCTSAVAPAAFAGATLSAGVSGGILFTAAHELVHGCSWLDRGLSNMLLACVGYMHWGESHLAHHVKVATPEDPASSRRGENLYAFIPRSVWGNLVDGYAAEAKRLRKRGIPLLSLRNRMVWWLACPAGLAAAAFALYGWKGLAFWAGQAVGSVLMLETVNYIEHYGLQRQKKADGRYEKCGPQHSWSTSHVFTDSVSFRLERHADHHMHGSRPFHLLRNLPDAPQLPISYPSAMILALVPPLYMHIMHPLLDSFAASRAAAAGGANKGSAEVASAGADGGAEAAAA